MQRSLTMVFHAVIPARFLSLTAHLVLNIMLFWSRVSGHLEITARVVIRAPRYWLPMATNIPGGYNVGAQVCVRWLDHLVSFLGSPPCKQWKPGAVMAGNKALALHP